MQRFPSAWSTYPLRVIKNITVRIHIPQDAQPGTLHHQFVVVQCFNFTQLTFRLCSSFVLELGIDPPHNRKRHFYGVQICCHLCELTLSPFLSLSLSLSSSLSVNRAVRVMCCVCILIGKILGQIARIHKVVARQVFLALNVLLPKH